MLALNRVQVMKRAKPALWWFVTLGCSLFGILSIWMGLDQGGAVPWLTCLFFGGGGSAFLYLGVQPAQPYQPGLSFKALRRPDTAITRNYRLTVFAGLTILFATVIWSLTEGLSASVLGRSLIGGLGLSAYGYYCLIAKRVHGDVDAVAVDLAHEHGSLSRNRIYLAYLNFSSSDQQNRNGNSILLFCADRLITCRFDDYAWHSSEKSFGSIAALGFRNQDTETHIYFEFDDSSTFDVALDPTHITTTEPQTFARSFLSLLDSWCEAPQGVVTPASSRRRIVTSSAKPVDTSEPVALVGQAQEAQFATAAINGALAVFTPQPRQLEI